MKFIELGPRFYQKYVEREIINHRLLAHPHIVGFKEVFVTDKVRLPLCVPMPVHVPVCFCACTRVLLGAVWRMLPLLHRPREARCPSSAAAPAAHACMQHLAIVMEYVGGGNLQQYVEAAGRLPEWQARCFFQQLILALQYCHANLRIAHRDIKLGNVLLNTKYQIPILKVWVRWGVRWGGWGGGRGGARSQVRCVASPFRPGLSPSASPHLPTYPHPHIARCSSATLATRKT